MKANQPLNHAQKGALSILASQAFKAAKARFAVEDGTKLEDYRRAGQLAATGLESLTAMTQAHFLYVRGHWHTIIGNAELAFDDFMNAGVDKEARRQMWYRYAGQVARLAEGIAARHQDEGHPITPEQAAAEAFAYALSISRDKYQGCAPLDLTPGELAKLGFTLYNRASDMLGKGSSQNRNKRQRAGEYRTPATTATPADESPSFMQRTRSRLASPLQPTADPVPRA